MSNTSSKRIVDQAKPGPLIAITGGIGSGKSVVSRILRAMGFNVYDCDYNARWLMDSDSAIKDGIAAAISRECITPAGEIDREKLASIVFSDPERLRTLNSLVHGSVRRHLSQWHSSLPGRVNFVETAILYQSGLDAMVDEVWNVEAPEELRIERVMKRSNLDPDQIKARMESQDSFVPVTVHPVTRHLINDGVIPLLPLVEKLIAEVTCQ